MDDSENLAKLLSHLPPETFRTFLVDEFGLDLPVLDPKQPKRTQKATLREALVALDLKIRQRLEDVAERFVLLSDGPGRDVVEGYSTNIVGDADKARFAALRSQYERALWLYRHEPELFAEALNARQADVYRQSSTCYSGYRATPDLTVRTDDTAREAFRQVVFPVLGCPPEQVLVEVFKRLRPDSQSGADVDLYQISVRSNRPPEIVGYIQDGEVETQEVTRMDAAHITYEPANGHLEVLSRFTAGREALARLAADTLLCAPISGEKIPLKQYDYQCLAGPYVFGIVDEPLVASTRVTELGFTHAQGRSLLVKLRGNDPDDIHTVACQLAGTHFDFRHHVIDYVKLSIRLRKVGKDRARTVIVVLRGQNGCNIKTKREKDRALCDRLLVKWHLLKEVGDGDTVPVDDLAA